VTVSKELRQLQKLAKAQGWVIEHTRNGHLAWTSPAGVTVYSPTTPGDRRSWLNVRTKLVEHGFKRDWKRGES
jgi:hypothetical protein